MRRSEEYKERRRVPKIPWQLLSSRPLARGRLVGPPNPLPELGSFQCFSGARTKGPPLISARGPSMRRANWSRKTRHPGLAPVRDAGIPSRVFGPSAANSGLLPSVNALMPRTAIGFAIYTLLSPATGRTRRLSPATLAFAVFLSRAACGNRARSAREMAPRACAPGGTVKSTRPCSRRPVARKSKPKRTPGGMLVFLGVEDETMVAPRATARMLKPASLLAGS